MLAGMTAPFPLIEVSGPPRERGRQYGRQAATRIARGVEHYAAQLGRMRVDWPAVRGLVQDYLPEIERFDPTYVDEMRGIAEGAGLELEAIVLLNARTEILKRGAKAVSGPRPTRRSRSIPSGASSCTPTTS